MFRLYTYLAALLLTAAIYTLPASAQSSNVSATLREIATTDVAKLPSLALAYQQVHDYASAAAAWDRYVTLAPTLQARATALAAGIHSLSYLSDSVLAFQNLKRVSSYLMELEQLINGTKDVNNAFLSAILSAYLDMTENPAWSRQELAADSALTLVRRASNRGVKLPIAANVYHKLAMYAIRNRRPEYALTLLREGLTVVDSSYQIGLRSSLRSVALIGRPAPLLKPDFWLNSGADSGATHNFLGRITIIEMTSVGCTSCVSGYSILTRIAARYQNLKVTPVLLTNICMQDKSIDAELEVDRKYWLNKYQWKYPIYITDQPHGLVTYPDGTLAEPGESSLLAEYGGLGLPKYILVDAEGIVRYVQYGHSWTLERDIVSVIESIKHNKPTF